MSSPPSHVAAVKAALGALSAPNAAFTACPSAGGAQLAVWGARERGGVEVAQLVGALGELPPVRGPHVAVVVDGVVRVGAAFAEAAELHDVGPADGGVALELDHAG